MIRTFRWLVLLGWLSGTCVLHSADVTVEQWLDGRTNTVPYPTSVVEVEEHLSAIRQALAVGGTRAERAWTLVFNLGPKAASLYPEIRRAFLTVPQEQRRYRSGDAIEHLGPLASDLIADFLSDPVKHGLTWEQVIPLSTDCAVLVPGLRTALAGTDPTMVRDAALAVQKESWSPALGACIPDLVDALERWKSLPPINQGPGFLSFQGDPRDPDYQEDLRWAEERTVPDPWPAVLVALAAVGPDHPAVITACRANLTAEASAHRRRAALEALASIALPDAEVRSLATPWLGSGRRGSLALSAITRSCEAPLEILAGLPKESALAVAHTIARQSFYARRQPLPPSWVPWLLEGDGRDNLRYFELLPWCGVEGIDAAFRAGGEVARRAEFGLYESLAPPPATMPTGLMAYLTHDDERRRDLACAVLKNGYVAGWMADLVPELIARRAEFTHGDFDAILVARAVEGDQRALDWLKERVSASDRNAVGTASWWREALPQEMREAIPPFRSTYHDTPGLLQRLADQPLTIVSVDREGLASLWHHGSVPEACWPGLLARARGGQEDPLIPLLLMRDPRYHAEGLAMLRHRLALSGSAAFNGLWYAGVRAAIPRALLQPWFNAGSAQARRMARDVAEP